MSELITVRLVSNRVKVTQGTECVYRQTKKVLPKVLKRVKTGMSGNKPVYKYFAFLNVPRYVKKLNKADPGRMMEVPVDSKLNPNWSPPRKGWKNNHLEIA